MKSEGPRHAWKPKVDGIIRELGKTRNALLPCLEAVQQEAGCIPQEAITYLRETIEVPSVDIYGVITFYGMLTTEKQGKYVIRVCDSLPCYLNGSREIIEALEDELGMNGRDTTPDGMFTLERVACLGLCDKAPAMIINEEIHGDLNAEKVREIIGMKKKEECGWKGYY